MPEIFHLEFLQGFPLHAQSFFSSTKLVSSSFKHHKLVSSLMKAGKEKFGRKNTTLKLFHEMFLHGYSLQAKLFFSSTKLVSTNRKKYAGVVLLIANQFNSFMWNIFAMREKLQVR